MREEVALGRLKCRKAWERLKSLSYGGGPVDNPAHSQPHVQSAIVPLFVWVSRVNRSIIRIQIEKQLVSSFAPVELATGPRGRDTPSPL